MTTQMPRHGVCPEYQLLLERCQQALVSWQQRRMLLDRATMTGKSPVSALQTLQANYSRAYAQLENHEHSCLTCQYISKIGGLDFESMASVLDQQRRAS